MNSSVLDPAVEHAIVLYHRISGPIFFIVNAVVGIIIIADKDKRSRQYRKYLLTQQVFSTLTDVLFTFCIPILMVNKQVIYNAGWNPIQYRTSTFLIIFFIFFTEIGSSYFSCAYYRRNAIFPEGHVFRWSGWKKTALLFVVRVYALLAAALIYYCTLQIDTPDEEIPSSLSWVLSKPAHMVLRANAWLYLLFAVILLWGVSIFTVIIAIVIEVSRQLNKGTAFSPATKRYQIRAVRSLKLQGAVPGIVYIVPVIGEFFILIYSSLHGTDDVDSNATSEEAGVRNPIQPSLHFTLALVNSAVTTLSALLFNIISMHTLVKSITTLVCIKSYQHAHFGVLCRSQQGLVHSSNFVASTRSRNSETPART